MKLKFTFSIANANTHTRTHLYETLCMVVCVFVCLHVIVCLFDRERRSVLRHFRVESRCVQYADALLLSCARKKQNNRINKRKTILSNVKKNDKSTHTHTYTHTTYPTNNRINSNKRKSAFIILATAQSTK